MEDIGSSEGYSEGLHASGEGGDFIFNQLKLGQAAAAGLPQIPGTPLIQEDEHTTGDSTEVGEFRGIPVMSGISAASVESNAGMTASPVDQAPGQSGVAVGSEGVVWRCLGCRTCNHVSNRSCGNCQAARPLPTAGLKDIDPAAALEQLTRRKAAIEAERTAVEDELKAVQRIVDFQREMEALKQPQDLTAESLARAMGIVNLLDIARTGDARLLQQLEKLGALGSLPGINKRHPFKPPGWAISDNLTALMIASFLGHSTVVQFLLKVPGVDTNLKDKDEWTALIFASCYGGTGAVQALLADARVEVNLQTMSGYTALVYASSNGHTASVTALLADLRVEVNVQDMFGYTALIHASNNGHTDVVQALLADARVEVNLQDKHGKTALDYAVEYERTDIVPLLKAKGATGKQM